MDSNPDQMNFGLDSGIQNKWPSAVVGSSQFQNQDGSDVRQTDALDQPPIQNGTSTSNAKQQAADLIQTVKDNIRLNGVKYSVPDLVGGGASQSGEPDMSGLVQSNSINICQVVNPPSKKSADTCDTCSKC